MGKTFVYNQTVEDSESMEYLDLSFGMFFDGTLNNRENSKLRAKVLDGTATPEEQALYKENSVDISDKIFGNSPNNSYVNDFSNIARQSMCCLQKYAIYIEGIGTEDREHDSTSGFMLGSGKTGIRDKVRKGCEELVNRIKEIKKNNRKQDIRNLTLDVLGFSRGAAAARNFLYEVNVKPAYPAQKQQQVIEQSNNYARVITDFKDSDGELIDESLLENNLLPARGHFGYKLLESGAFSKEELENLTLTIRFLGVYDTVSSYEEAGDGDAPVMYTGMKRLAVNIFNDVEELQLNNLGPIKKAVHFTAMDEHRENFSLTRLSIHGAIEKAFPGVHSDIGGSYDSGVEIINEVETSNNISEEELITFR
ncbi:DUF2235 domain-containing protein [Apibacter muscae]|nr:DUF2235 domain-containing protein [Apibacter muscae]